MGSIIQRQLNVIAAYPKGHEIGVAIFEEGIRKNYDWLIGFH